MHVSGHSTHVAARPACPPWYQQQPLPSLALDLVTAGPTHPRGQSCPTESETGQQRTGAPSFRAPPANELRLVHRGANYLPFPVIIMGTADCSFLEASHFNTRTRKGGKNQA